MMLPSLRRPAFTAALATIIWIATTPPGTLRANHSSHEPQAAAATSFPLKSIEFEQIATSDRQDSHDTNELISIDLDSEPTVDSDPSAVAADLLDSASATGSGCQCDRCRLAAQQDSVNENLDRFWLISTRHLTSRVSRLDLEHPDLAVYRLHPGSQSSRVALEDYLQSISERKKAVLYVHGNRIPSDHAVSRSFAVYRSIKQRRGGAPIDWVIWSWPSDKQGFLIYDARLKASRTDGQGLYLGWLLRRHAEAEVPTSLIGYSFGGRVITGALHAAAGGSLGGRTVSGPAVIGGPFDAGLVAPAVDRHWLTNQGYHRLATQNLQHLVLLYNRRDAVLKRYWLVDRVRGRMALGYSGPTSFAPRFDGSKLPIRSRDCSPSIGLQHDELDYYRKRCQAGSEMAKLIDDFYVNH